MNILEDCEECNGKGFVVPKNREHIIYRCASCNGLGKLDWVEKVTQSFRSKSTPSMWNLLEKWKKDTGMDFISMRTTNSWTFGEKIHKNEY